MVHLVTEQPAAVAFAALAGCKAQQLQLAAAPVGYMAWWWYLKAAASADHATEAAMEALVAGVS